MRTRPWGSPPGFLPALHAFELSRVIDLYHAVDLSIRMGVVLTRVNFLAIHEDGCNTEESGLGCRVGDPSAPVLGAIELRLGYPSFLDTLPNKPAEVFVVRISRAIFLVESGLKVLPRGSGG